MEPPDPGPPPGPSCHRTLTTDNNKQNETAIDYNASQSTNMNKYTNSFANVLKNQIIQPITKEQAIIINGVKEIPSYEFVYAIGNIIGSKNITFFSRKSNNRIIIYLTSRYLVEKLTSNETTIQIENQTFNIRKYINKNQRIILSNVCPTIPHEILELELQKLGLKLTSNMSFLRAGLKDKEYAHILSFRRHIFISKDESQPEITLPNSILVEYDGETNRIYITDETNVCSLCKKPGHTNQNCKQTITETQPENSKLPDPSNQNVNLNTTQEIDIAIEEILTTNNTTKRPASTSSATYSICSDLNEKTTTELPTKIDKTKNKKQKSDTPLTKTMLEPVKAIIEGNTHYPLNLDKLAEFLNESSGINDKLTIAKSFTDNIDDLIIMMKELYPKLEHRTIKTRFTKNIKRLEIQIEDDGNSDLSSQNDQDSTVEY